jgi:hypothetical protein
MIVHDLSESEARIGVRILRVRTSGRLPASRISARPGLEDPQRAKVRQPRAAKGLPPAEKSEGPY